MVPYSTKMSETIRRMGGRAVKKGGLWKKGTHSPAVGIPLIPHSNIQGGAPRPGCSQHTWTERHLWKAPAGCFCEEAWTHSPPHLIPLPIHMQRTYLAWWDHEQLKMQARGPEYACSLNAGQTPPNKSMAGGKRTPPSVRLAVAKDYKWIQEQSWSPTYSEYIFFI